MSINVDVNESARKRMLRKGRSLRSINRFFNAHPIIAALCGWLVLLALVVTFVPRDADQGAAHVYAGKVT